MRAWAFVLVCLPAVAAAQAPSKNDAEGHLERGKRRYELQDYDGAIAELEAGYLIDRRAEFLYVIGQSYRMKGNCERAIRSYTAVLQAPDGAPLARAAEQNIARCKDQLAKAPDPAPQPVPAPAVPPPVQPPAEAPWYSDKLAGVLVLGGTVMLAGGTVAWQLGRGDASRTYDAENYEVWLERARAARNAETLQWVGTTAMALGTGMVVAGVLRYVWPTERATATVTPTAVTAELSFAF